MQYIPGFFCENNVTDKRQYIPEFYTDLPTDVLEKSGLP